MKNIDDFLSDYLIYHYQNDMVKYRRYTQDGSEITIYYIWAGDDMPTQMTISMMDLVIFIYNSLNENK